MFQDGQPHRRAHVMMWLGVISPQKKSKCPHPGAHSLSQIFRGWGRQLRLNAPHIPGVLLPFGLNTERCIIWFVCVTLQWRLSIVFSGACQRYSCTQGAVWIRERHLSAMFLGCSYFVPKHHCTECQRSAGILSTDSLFVTATAGVKENGYGTEGRNGKYHSYVGTIYFYFFLLSATKLHYFSGTLQMTLREL